MSAIQQIDVEEHAELADMMRLRLAIGVKEDGSKWTIIDEGLLDRLSKVRIDITVGSRTETLMTTYVIRTSASLSNQPGESSFDVVAMGPTVLMNLEETIRAWPDMSDSEIATAVFSDAKYRFKPIVDSTDVHRSLEEHQVIQRETDIRFLQRLARRNGFECYVEVNPKSGKPEGHFHAPRPDKAPQGALSVNLGEATNVNAFTASYDMLRPTTARVVGLDIESQSDQPADIDRLKISTLGKAPTLGGNRIRHVLLGQTGLAQTGELQTLAQATVDRFAWAIQADGELNTVAYGGLLRAKRPIQVRGAGLRFSGTYYVERVLHTFTSDGYVQQFTLRRNALGVPGKEDLVEVGAEK